MFQSMQHYPSALLEWTNYEINKWEPIKSKKGVKDRKAPYVLVNQLLRLLYTVEGVKPKLPHITTINEYYNSRPNDEDKNDYKYDRADKTTLKRYMLLKHALNIVDAHLVDDRMIKRILYERKIINWKSDKAILKLIIYFDEQTIDKLHKLADEHEETK